jgi:formate hydrogenlyase transcriptional activator
MATMASPDLCSSPRPGPATGGGAASRTDILEEALRDREKLLRAVTDGAMAVTGSAFHASLVRHLAISMQVRFVFVAECRDAIRARVRAFWRDGDFGENFEYRANGSPCLEVARGNVRYYVDKVRQLFPADDALARLGVEGYLGVPALSSAGRVVGHLVVLDDKPIDRAPFWIPVLQTFAARAGAELERERTDVRLGEALREVQELKNRLEAENAYLQEEIRTTHNFDDIVGSSPSLLAALRKVELVAPTGSTVLIAGETGSGKELFARAVHSRSGRSSRPLVKVNCGAIAPGLVESELFGHVKGAFTGAVDKRIGRFELADGGTILLDEISELPLDAQVKLLRVLQEHEFEPVGSSRTIRADVRVIAATNRDLERAVAEGKFRDDLLYRLNVFPIRVPPLRERTSDIDLLVPFFITGLARKLGKPVKRFNEQSMRRLREYSWPGNVRELQNVVERAAILSPGPILDLDGTLPASTYPSRTPLPASPSESSVARGADKLEDIERAHIFAVLRRTDGVVSGPRGAATILGLRPNTLRSRMKRLGIGS